MMAGSKIFQPVFVLTLSILIFLSADFKIASAEQLPQPEDRVLLTISGKISNDNGDGKVRLDRAMLENLPAATLHTDTPWTKKVTEFHGPLASALIKYVGAEGETLKMIALNDYAVEVPVSDLLSYQVILAMVIDGKKIGVRNRGPLWLMYPWDEHPELRNDRFYARSIWQLKEIVVE